jgi:serine/threonine-protein kinase
VPEGQQASRELSEQIAFRNLLADLYSNDQARARSVVGDAGFEVIRFNLVGDPVSLWFKALEEARRQAGTWPAARDRLLAIVRTEYPEMAAQYAATLATTPEGAPGHVSARLSGAHEASLIEQLTAAFARRDALRESGQDTKAIQHEIHGIKRELRELGQLRAGDRLGDGRYLLLGQIGRGGFATVWKAHDKVGRCDVAIKVMHPSLAGDSWRLERFLRGARIMRVLEHPNIVRVLETAGEDGGFRYFVMELLPGGDLRTPPDRSPDALLALVQDVSAALALAHGKGFIHRDVKPSNIVLGSDGRAKLTDFDLVGHDETTGGTHTEGPLGTIAFAAPEALTRPKEATAAADVYSLGVTAIFLLGNRQPSFIELIQQWEVIIGDLPCTNPVKGVLAKAIRIAPHERFKDALDFGKALHDAIGGRGGWAKLMNRSAWEPVSPPTIRESQPDSRYRITERIAAGGMAEVFRGVAESMRGFKKNIAIKRILPSLTKNKKFVAMFLDEARVSLALQHANIVQVFDIGHTDDTYFIVMEYVDGIDLKALLEWRRRINRRVPIAHGIYIVIETCKGLAYAHDLQNPETGQSLGIVHRDISPPNVLLSKQGEIKVVDFGLAKATSQVEITDPGVVKGKMSYLSPEAARGEEVDDRADIFAVGILLYEVLTGKRLFYGETDYQTVELVRNARIPPIRPQNPQVESELEDIVRRALARRKEDRYQSANDLQDALARYAYSRGLKVIPPDIGELVRQCLDDRRMQSGEGKHKPTIVDHLLQDEIAKITDADFDELGEPVSPGLDLGPDLIDPRSWAETAFGELAKQKTSKPDDEN